LESRYEIPAGEPVQIKQRQYFRHFRRATHVGRHDHALEAPPLAILLHPFVVNPRCPDFHRSGAAENLALSSVTVAHHQGVAMSIAFAFGRLEVVLYLGLQCFGEHLPCSGSSDLVEVEQEFFAIALNLMYPLHRCLLPADAPTSVFRFDCSKGRYTMLFSKSPIHNFRSYLRKEDA
jgi:hypothetical protein